MEPLLIRARLSLETVALTSLVALTLTGTRGPMLETYSQVMAVNGLTMILMDLATTSIIVH